MKMMRRLFQGIVGIMVMVAMVTSLSFADVRQGFLNYQDGEYEAALKAVEGMEETPEVLYLKGISYYKLGDYEKSEDALTAVLEEKPDDAKASTNLARALMKLDEYEKALPYARQGAEADSDSGAYNVLGMVQMRLGNFDQAKAALDKAIELNPKNPWPYNNKGFMLILKNREDLKSIAEEAMGYFKKAMELAPNNELFRRNMEFMEKVQGESYL